MRKLFTLTAAALALAVFGFATPSQTRADVYADEVAGSSGVSALVCCDDPDDALGAPDAVGTGTGDFAGFVTIENTGTLTLDFNDNVCLEDGDNASPDLRVHEYLGDTENFTVAVGLQGGALSATVNGIGESAADGDPDELIELNGVAAGAFFNQTRITSLNDIGTAPGTDVDAVECFFTLDLADIVKDYAVHGNDGGTFDEIDQTSPDGFDDQQFKAFTIVITNNTGVDGGLSGLTFIDVVPAEFDLDPVEEDVVNSCDSNGEVCDGVDVTAADEDVADCTAIGAEGGAKGKGKGNQKLAPDVVTMTAGGLDDGDSCTITVWVMTDDDHPGQGNNPTWTPTSCPVTLNDGVKVFDGSFNLLLQDDDTLIFDDNDPVSEGVCNEAS